MAKVPSDLDIAQAAKLKLIVEINRGNGLSRSLPQLVQENALTSRRKEDSTYPNALANVTS